MPNRSGLSSELFKALPDRQVSAGGRDLPRVPTSAPRPRSPADGRRIGVSPAQESVWNAAHFSFGSLSLSHQVSRSCCYGAAFGAHFERRLAEEESRSQCSRLSPCVTRPATSWVSWSLRQRGRLPTRDRFPMECFLRGGPYMDGWQRTQRWARRCTGRSVTSQQTDDRTVVRVPERSAARPRQSDGAVRPGRSVSSKTSS